ncbi:MAG: hypothetical protein R6X34_30495 [Chloroflexota bacterium]
MTDSEAITISLVIETFFNGGDKAYNDTELEDRLWRKRRIHLIPLRKSNQMKQWSDDVRRAMGRVIHLTETVSAC